jgi:hypothetical protein
MKTQIKRALVFTKKTSTLVTKGRALLQIEKKGRASLGQGRTSENTVDVVSIHRGLNRFHRGHTAYIPYHRGPMVYIPYRGHAAYIP